MTIINKVAYVLSVSCMAFAIVAMLFNRIEHAQLHTLNAILLWLMASSGERDD